MEQIASVYIPADWRHALAQGAHLPDRTHGAALFADISGFTPLTEALTRALGLRRGAEELPRQLNRVYDALIARVDNFGGSVISFAGDAITCWFADTAPQPAAAAPSLRAVACAWAMQQAMQPFSSVTIPGGPSSLDGGETVALSVKIAIASGQARRFLVGDPTIQLIDALAGKTLGRVAQGERLAEKGQVLVDAQTAQELGTCLKATEWRESSETGERFAVVDALTCDVPPAPWLPLPSDTLRAEQIRAWLLPSVYERLCAGLGEFMTELRPTLTLFLRFEGIDYDGDEQAGDKLDAYVRWVQQTLARHAGTLLQLIIGDKGSSLYAAFGAPVAHEDDAWRAVNAALDLREPPTDLRFIAPPQIGLSQGIMRTGAYGGVTRRTYGVLGDEVNVAARLMQHAAPGEVLISERAGRAVSSAFTWQTLSPIPVKGKREPVRASRVTGKRLMASGLAAYAGALIGREAELAQLGEILSRVLTGQGQIVRLEGEMGMGKSHLVAEFAVDALGRGAQVCFGFCLGAEQNVAYFPWRSIVRALLELTDESPGDQPPAAVQTRSVAQVEAALKRLHPDWTIRLPLLGAVLGLPIPDNPTTAAFDPRLRQEALFALMVELAQTCARRRPLVLILEDVHWMDEASIGLTLALARVVAVTG